MIPGSIAIKRLGILRNDALGDTLLTLPVASAVKQFEPATEVELICHESFSSLFKAHPDLDAVIADPGGSSFDLARLLRERHYDAILVLRPTPRNARAAFFARVPMRVGTAYRAYGMLFNTRWYGHRKLNEHHEVEYNLQLLRRLIGPIPGSPQYYLPPPSGDEDSAQKVLSDAGVVRDRPLVAIHPGFRIRPDGKRSALSWPNQHYVTLAELLIARGCQVVVTGTDEDTEMTGAVAAVEQTIDLTGKTTLGQLAWILKTCDTMVANSTGVLHLGAAVGTKVIGIYPGSESTSPVRWGPYGKGHKVFRVPVDICGRRGCAWEECPDYNCLERILPEEVVAVVEGLISQSPLRSRRRETTTGKGEGG
ncbi:glycosyltransferase family 9 protein [Candidatus Zixiibacteriota bacterium]